MIIPSDLKYVQGVIKKLQSVLKEKKANEKVFFDLKLAVEEALVNAIKHGNKLNKSLQVKVGFEVSPQKIVISVEDEGEGFGYKKIPNPTKDENLPKPHGRGVFLIKEVMDEVSFNRKGNKITMVKYLKEA